MSVFPNMLRKDKFKCNREGLNSHRDLLHLISYLIFLFSSYPRLIIQNRKKIFSGFALNCQVWSAECRVQSAECRVSKMPIH